MVALESKSVSAVGLIVPQEERGYCTHLHRKSCAIFDNIRKLSHNQESESVYIPFERSPGRNNIAG